MASLSLLALSLVSVKVPYFSTTHSVLSVLSVIVIQGFVFSLMPQRQFFSSPILLKAGLLQCVLLTSQLLTAVRFMLFSSLIPL